MSKELLKAILGAAICGPHLTARLEFFQCQAHGSVVLSGKILEGLNDFLILTLREQEFGCLPKSDNSDSKDAHDEYKCSVAEPDVPPALCRY